MFNPVQEALNAFLTIARYLPFSITALLNLSLFLFIVPVILSHFNNIRWFYRVCFYWFLGLFYFFFSSLVCCYLSCYNFFLFFTSYFQNCCFCFWCHSFPLRWCYFDFWRYFGSSMPFFYYLEAFHILVYSGYSNHTGTIFSFPYFFFYRYHFCCSYDYFQSGYFSYYCFYFF